MHVRFEPAVVDDGPAILRLLSDSGLPVDGLVEHLNTAIVARADGRVIGCAALEIHPDGALLRSVAVDAALKSRGLGTELTRLALNLAVRLGMPAVYLLTTTAEGFFPRFGFQRIERDAVPASVRTSVEFQSACPSTALVMKRPTEP
jgi:amino-acid N-acetyltransferase